jgi:predicted short-subunit dehydrogenase-like oxidoreductase (DUF2520 family)
MNSRPALVIVGCGKVGGSLALQLKRRNWAITGIAGRRLSSAQASADDLGVGCATDAPWEITRDADIVVITTPDAVIRTACETIAGRHGFSPGVVVLHCSGAHSSSLLESAAEAGASVGSMHPLQSFAAVVRDKNPFEGIIMAVEGMPDAAAVAGEMAATLGARVLPIETDGKTLYHAAAVVASNYLVSLTDIAVEMLKTAGIAEADAYPVLAPLIEGTLANIARVGTTDALTGPIVRGDHETVALHVEALGNMRPELLPAYAVLGLQALDVSSRKGHLDPRIVKKLKTLLKDDA